MIDRVTILICIDTLTSGGAEKLLIQMLKRFDYHIFKIDLFVMYHIGVYFDDIPQQVNFFTKENERGHLSKKYDIEIAFLEGAPTKYIAQRKTMALKIAWVHIDLLTMHWTQRYYTNNIEEETCYSLFHKIVFVSHGAMKQFEKLFPRVETYKQVILNLIDREEIIENATLFQVPKTKMTICSVGRLKPQKGFDRLIPIIDQLSRVDQLDFHYWIVGSGQQEDYLKKMIYKLNLNETVHLEGFHKNPYPFIKCSDIFASVSIAEGYPLVLAEALCLGKAILSTKVAGTTELLDYGDAGLLVDTDDQSVYEGLKKIIYSADLRASLSKKAKKRSEIFDPRKTMDQVYKLFSFNYKV